MKSAWEGRPVEEYLEPVDERLKAPELVPLVSGVGTFRLAVNLALVNDAGLLVYYICGE